MVKSTPTIVIPKDAYRGFQIADDFMGHSWRELLTVMTAYKRYMKLSEVTDPDLALFLENSAAMEL
jgi:hypothetical protein